ncbi:MULTISPECIES: CAAX protease [unclassified Leptolyngbya]|uniref:Yip1 family protein n=1 Tax=unclassified Leptolyngbya TaxID=2650499 RepID=UPI00168A299D|nr:MULTISPECIES: CAAX protease [unclassified Leptolyngbya]MBD1911671.1 CAAX protease [Leptolyngbya sp. FACHB-8]MBD2154590.1 CAAX protease [Leptolyngbya sp. FACHB-16]
MGNSRFAHFWDFLGGVFSLNGETFQQIVAVPWGFWFALEVVLAAGLSLAVGQSIILFINRVRPVRFIFSLLLNAVLYVCGFLFLVFSTWLITLFPWAVQASLGDLIRVLGITYAPLLFGFLAAIPYLGIPLLTLLSVWHFLALVVGFAGLTEVSLTQSIWYVAVGWGVLQILQRVIGQPIANLGRWVADKVAGVELSTNRQDVLEMVRSRMAEATSPLLTAPNPSPIPEAQQLIKTARQRVENLAENIVRNAPSDADAALVFKDESTRWGWVKVASGLVGMLLLAYIVAVLLAPVRDGLFGWYATLPGVLRFLFDLMWIGVIALAFAGLLAPLETLGWWAGWYDDEINTNVNVGELAEPITDPRSISRYIIYLDGIGQSTAEYLPDVEDFLDSLTPALPDNIALIRGLVSYSVLNNPLDEDRPLAFLWRLADKQRWTNPASLLGVLVNLRNVLIVGVSSDKRYGPLYNRGIAQVMHNALLKNGYQTGSGVPITLIGYSGGGQMACASAAFLKRAIGAPIDVISLGGVISANNNILVLEHLYHLVGGKDNVEKIGPIMFPGRWKLFPLSYWNRAKRLGKISFIALGSTVGHQLPGGLMDPKARVPDGRTNLQQTIDFIVQILQGQLLRSRDRLPQKMSQYTRYQEAAFNRYTYYPAQQVVDTQWYQPIAPWIGRLILPTREERPQVRGVWFEVYHAAQGYEHLVGRKVKLQWLEEPALCSLVNAVTRDVHFSADAEYTSTYGGLVHPTRLNHRQQVGPLESLAGSHPQDDITVMLEGLVQVDAGNPATLRIQSTPVQVTGRYYALVRFHSPVGHDAFQVVHFNRATRQFDGPMEVVQTPPVLRAADYGSCPSTLRDIERSPLNETGWYIYGAKNEAGQFVVQSLAPRSLFRLQPDRVIVGNKAGYRYIRKESWANVAAQKGKINSVLITPREESNQRAIDEWREGDRALVLHTYGGIGGKKKEPAAGGPIFFGHFAYGLAKVIRDPLVDELRFDIQYYQVYTHNIDGLTAGTLHWSRYMGDRQLGWLGNRPTCDIVIKLKAFTDSFSAHDLRQSALDVMLAALQVMTARYRIGDGTGGTYVGPANNCSQDSNQALFNSLRYIERRIERANAASLSQWMNDNPEQAKRYQDLVQVGNALERELQPLGGPRPDWEKNEFNLGSTLQDEPLRNLWIGIGSWRTLLPRKASDTIVRVFLQHNASVWVLRTNQVGGYDPDIEPIAPMTL